MKKQYLCTIMSGVDAMIKAKKQWFAVFLISICYN